MAPVTRSRFILGTTLGYGVFATLWIFLTDRVIAVFTDLSDAVWFSTVKGMVFVLLTTAALYFGLHFVPDAAPGTREHDDGDTGTVEVRNTLRWPPWLGYSFAAAATFGIFVLRTGIADAVVDKPLLILFVLPIALSALWGGLGPGLLATVGAGLGGAWVTPPSGGFAIADPVDRFQVAMLLGSGLLISVTSEALHRSRRRAIERLDALERSERRYRDLFEANPHPMWVYDLESLAFLAVNDAAVARYGYTRDEFHSMTLRDIRPPEDVPALLDNVRQSSAPAQSSGLWRHLLKDGTEILVEISSHALRFGERSARVVLAHDVTTRVAAEQEIRRLNVDLERRVWERTTQLNDAVRELETFAYTVSHDLKAPLRGIDGYSQLLQEDHAEGLGAEGSTFITNIRRGVAQLQQLIDDLLSYSRIERRTLQVATVALGGVVERVVRERNDDLGARGVVLRCGVPADLTVRADADGLVLALRNLLDNAIKFTRDATPPSIEVGAKPDGDRCLIWVRDNGIGFDMKYHERLFEIFQRLQRAEDYAGTGIGLTIVRKAMQRMGGRVWAESEPGHGATFFLELPR